MAAPSAQAAPADAAAAFAQYDRNSSGAIEVDELKALLRERCCSAVCAGTACFPLLAFQRNLAAAGISRMHALAWSDARQLSPCSHPPAGDLGLLQGKGPDEAHAFVAQQARRGAAPGR